jgi:hypothetical protein
MNQQQMYGMWALQQQGHNAAMMHMHMSGMGYPTSSYGMPSPQTQYGMNPMSAYGANIGGGYQQSVYGGNMMGGAGYAQAVQQDGFIDRKTHDRVNAWRQSVQPS